MPKGGPNSAAADQQSLIRRATCCSPQFSRLSLKSDVKHFRAKVNHLLVFFLNATKHICLTNKILVICCNFIKNVI